MGGTGPETNAVLRGPVNVVVKHPPHTNPGEYHLNVYDGPAQIFAINQSGKAHDQSHKARIPNNVADGMRKHFPKFVIPDDNFIESIGEMDRLLIETAAECSLDQLLG